MPLFFDLRSEDRNRDRVTISDGRGMSACILRYGATVQSLNVPDARGDVRDVVLGYESPAAYDMQDAYLGAIVGRVCGRIRDASYFENGRRIDLVPNESEPECENQGSYGSKTFLNKITLVLPGTGKKVTGLISNLNDDDVVFLVPMADGKCRLFGSPAFHTELVLKQSFGKSATDPNTTTIEVSVTDEYAAPFYEGVIETAYGDINGATDELVTT